MMNDVSNLSPRMTSGQKPVRHSSFRHSSAFTLLEIVLVLVIITIALAAAAPSLGNFSAGRTAADTATQFVAVTHLARTQAISEGAVHRVNIDPTAGKWWITYDDGTGNFVELQSNKTRMYSTPTNVKIDTTAPQIDGANVIEFQPTGRTDLANITITGPNSKIEITCDAPFNLYHIVPAGGAK